MRDYIVAHYRLNRRGDTDFWRENAANEALSPALKDLMTAWFTRRDIKEALVNACGASPAYPSMSWHCLFAGYGHFPEKGKLQPPPPAIPDRLAKTRAILEACERNFSDYRIA